MHTWFENKNNLLILASSVIESSYDFRTHNIELSDLLVYLGSKYSSQTEKKFGHAGHACTAYTAVWYTPFLTDFLTRGGIAQW